MQKERLQRNPWSVLARSCFPWTDDSTQSRWRSLLCMGRSCRSKIGGSLSISRETIPNQWENVLTSTKRCLHQTVYTEKLEDNNSGPCPTGSTRNGNRHRVLPPPGGNGEHPSGLPNNSKKVKKEAASTGLRSNGATRCLQNFGENLRRMAFKTSFILLQLARLQLTGGLL